MLSSQLMTDDTHCTARMALLFEMTLSPNNLWQ